jgi:hypothetical protein
MAFYYVGDIMLKAEGAINYNAGKDINIAACAN